jgi:hypothetical protein
MKMLQARFEWAVHSRYWKLQSSVHAP